MLLRLLFIIAFGVTLTLDRAAAQSGLPERFSTLKSIADQGDPDAQFFIGKHFYDQQSDDPLIIQQAEFWLQKSAAQDHPQAMLMLGKLMQFAADRAADQAAALGESFNWYQRAADLGLAEAQLRLGNFYLQGLGGLPQDCGLALHWYREADARGQPTADTNIVWLLSTCPDASIRDGSQALRLAMDIVYAQGRSGANNLDNLAAAFAEVGDFRSAWEVQEDALNQLGVDHPDREGYIRRLESYQQRRPWREAIAEQ
jgi:TPR repeat protein